MICRFPVVPKSVGDSCSEGAAPRSVGPLCRSGETLVGGTRWRVSVCDAGASPSRGPPHERRGVLPHPTREASRPDENRNCCSCEVCLLGAVGLGVCVKMLVLTLCYCCSPVTSPFLEVGQVVYLDAGRFFFSYGICDSECVNLLLID